MNLFWQDIPVILFWYVVTTLLGWLFFPLSSRIFKPFPDRGYALSKILGILLTAYSVWLVSSLHLGPFTRGTIWGVLGIWAIVNLFVFNQSIFKFPKSIFKLRTSNFTTRKLFIFEELLFLAGLLFWCFIRGHEPSLHSLEKYMDYGFMNAILKTTYFPPHDMWLSPMDDVRYTQGFFINYYYFGHYVTAFLTKLTGIASEVTYNLMLSTIFAFSLTASFSIAYTLIHKTLKKVSAAINGGLLTALLVTLAGNLHTIYVFTKGYENEHPVPFWGMLQFAWNPSYWYPNATRFIPNTIHEFPSYSWVVADLHGHVLDIPFVLLTLALLLNSFLNSLNTKYQILNTMFLGFLCAVMYMTNAWDGLIYLALSMGVIVTVSLFQKNQVNPDSSWFSSILKKFRAQLTSFGYQVRLGKGNAGMLAVSIAVLISSFVLAGLPFNFHFKPFVSGFGVVGGWEIARALHLIPETAETVVKVGPFLLEKGNNLRSPLWMLGVLWGFFYFFAAIFLAYILKKIKAFSSKYQILDTRYWKDLVATLHPVHLFLLILIGLSTLLLIFPEFFYAKDIYPAHYRANTMFKLGYQAYIMLSIVSGYTFILLSQKAAEKKKKLLKVVRLIAVSAILLVSIYSYFGIQSYYGVFSPVNRPYEGQDGIVWIKTAYPGDYETIQWLRTQPTTHNSQPTTILEAVGDSYTDYARMSAYTGLPTLLGWPVHEWLWRGSYDEPGRRVEEVKQVYEGTDATVVKELLKKFNVNYVIVGKLERDKYPGLNEELIKEVGKEVFTSGETTVYEITF